MKVNEAIWKPLESWAPVVVHQGGTSCFAPGTLVITKEGKKPIEQVNKNDLVLCFNEKTKKKEYKSALNVLRFDNNKRTVKLYLNNGKTITATEDHEFYYKGGWVSLKHLLSLRESKLKE